MRKLRLEMDDLRVETFETLPAEPRAGGTVYARQVTRDCFTPGCPPSVNPCVTRDLACFTRAC